jgi:transcription elongation factor Elf1
MKQIEHFFSCPHCGERISMLLDLSVPEQQYVEDCEVCCAPIEIRYSAIGDDLADFIAESSMR